MNNRVPFSFTQPFAVSHDLAVAGKRYAAGAPFPWRELGLDERGIWDLWRTFAVHCVPGSAKTAQQSKSQQSPHRR